MSVVNQPINIPPDLQRRGTTTATLVIPSRTGHRRTLEDYFVKAGGPDFSDISLGSVGWNRIWDNLAQAILVAGLNKKYENHGFIWYLKSKIAEMPFPTVTQDEAITIARNSGPSRIDAYFQDTQTGDVVDRTIDGGSLGKKNLLIVNLNNSTAVSATGSYFLDFLDMIDGMSPFIEGTDLTTGGRRVARNQTLTLYGIAADVPKNAGSKTTRIHLSQDTIELFTSENKEGILVDPDTENELAFKLNPLSIFWLPTPLDMKVDSLYTFKADAIFDGANALAIGSQKLFLICVRTIGVATP